MPHIDFPSQFDKEAEEAVLGSCLIDPRAGEYTLATGLEPKDFFLESNQAIFYAIRSLVNRGVAPDFVTVTDEMDKTGSLAEIGGTGYLSALVLMVPSSFNAVHYASIVHRMSLERQLGKAGFDLLQAAADADEGLPLRARKLHSEIGRITRGLQERTLKDEMQAVYDTTLKRITGELKDEVIRTSMTRLNKLLQGGLRRTDFTVVAGRTSQGKTALAATILHHISVVSKLPCVLYSYEMAPAQMMQRLVALRSGVPLRLIREGDIQDDHLLNRATIALAEIADSPLVIVSAAGWNIEEIAAHAQTLARQAPLAVVAIDYLQLVAVSPDLLKANRATQVSGVTAGAKQLAERLNVNVLGLSQLNRLVEIQDREPELSDLRESGGIEQDANQVLFVYDAPKKEQATMPEGYFAKILSLQKDRNGECGKTEVSYFGPLTRFVDYPLPKNVIYAQAS